MAANVKLPDIELGFSLSCWNDVDVVKGQWKTDSKYIPPPALLLTEHVVVQNVCLVKGVFIYYYPINMD